MVGVVQGGEGQHSNTPIMRDQQPSQNAPNARIYERLESVHELPELHQSAAAVGSIRLGSGGRMEAGLLAVGRHISELSGKKSSSSDLYETNLLEHDDMSLWVEDMSLWVEASGLFQLMTIFNKN